MTKINSERRLSRLAKSAQEDGTIFVNVVSFKMHPIIACIMRLAMLDETHP
jgi:hypothetical protein